MSQFIGFGHDACEICKDDAACYQVGEGDAIQMMCEDCHDLAQRMANDGLISYHEDDHDQ